MITRRRELWLLPAALAIVCGTDALAQVPGQAPTLNYAPPPAAPRAPYQLGVTTRPVNLNEYQVGAQNVASPPMAATSPAPPLSGSEAGRAPGANRNRSLAPGSPAPPLSGSGAGRYEGVTTGSPAPPLSGSGSGREDITLGQPLPPLSPSPAGRENARRLAPVPAPLPPSSPAPPGLGPVPSALVRRDAPPSLGPSVPVPAASTPRRRGGEKAGSGESSPSPSPSPSPAVPPVSPPPVNPQQAPPRPMPMPPGDVDDSPLPPPRLALEITTVVPGSLAQRMGLEPGDVILQANRYRLESHEQLKWVIANSGGRLRLKIINSRDGQETFVDGTL